MVKFHPLTSALNVKTSGFDIAAAFNGPKFEMIVPARSSRINEAIFFKSRIKVFFLSG